MDFWYDGALPAKIWSETEQRYIPAIVYHDKYLNLEDKEVRDLTDIMGNADINDEHAIIEYSWDVIDWSDIDELRGEKKIR